MSMCLSMKYIPKFEIDNLKRIYSLFKNHFCDAMIERQNWIKCSEISTH